MNNKSQCFLLLTVCCLTAVTVHARGVTPETIQVSVLKVNNELPSYREIHATSGDDLSLTVISPTVVFDLMTLELIQSAGKIAVKLPVTFDIIRGQDPIRTIYTIKFKLPKVKARTATFLKFQSEGLNCGTVPIFIYPPEDKAATGHAISQKMRENNIEHVFIYHHGGELTAASFLSDRGVKLDWADALSGSLCIAEIFAKDLKNLPPAANDRSRVIIFIRNSDQPPGIYTTLTADGGAVTKVTLPVMDDLKTNPRSREIFLNLINQHLSRDMAVEN